MNYEALIKIVVLAFAVSPISLTISKTKVSKPFREWIKSWNEWLGKLFSCPYCLSHWISFIMVGIFRPVAFSCGFFFLFDLIVSAFMMIAIATLISSGVFAAVIYMD